MILIFLWATGLIKIFCVQSKPVLKINYSGCVFWLTLISFSYPYRVDIDREKNPLPPKKLFWKAGQNFVKKSLRRSSCLAIHQESLSRGRIMFDMHRKESWRFDFLKLSLKTSRNHLLKVLTWLSRPKVISIRKKITDQIWGAGSCAKVAG